ncbi:hypothetical protein FRB95_005481 [Tulasnella sp. JGI-2019a]|nr:hypothetical protein FRB93_000036 [Tulasnella sp. JGI-2019a]KAG9029317.1 hypothetical protein FRB95_005481 [Tulasnella sp. JGI-2019a]
MFDILEAHEEGCKPWYTDAHPGKMTFVKYHETQEGVLQRNWVAVGDSFMKLNPFYGQGCTKAMMDAITLDSLLRRIPSHRDGFPTDFSKRFFQKAIGRTSSMWEGNKANDYG